MPRRFGEASSDERVATLTEEEEATLRAEEQKAMHEFRAAALKVAAKRANKAAEGVREMKDAALAKEVKALFRQNLDLEDKKQAIREQQKDIVARIAALEVEQADRKKAGWLAADLGA